MPDCSSALNPWSVGDVELLVPWACAEAPEETVFLDEDAAMGLINFLLARY